MSKIPFFKKPSPDIQGFDGLLMLVTIAAGAMGIGYLFSMYQGYYPYFMQYGFSFSTKTAEIYDVFRTYEFFVYLINVIILATTTLLLVKENRFSVKFINIAYPIYMALFIITYFIGAHVMDSGYNLSFFISLLQTLIFPVLLLIYINKSLRVKNTIINKKEIDYTKLVKKKKKNSKGTDMSTLWKNANSKIRRR
jgi:hypothetical protein